MFAWYKEARICYAYLSDVPWFEETHDHAQVYEKLWMSRWFSRGWTLQELLAPTHVKFFACDWRPIGSKMQLCSAVSEITGIAKSALLGKPLNDFNVAERMSWAADRETTRTEDLAYCLLGIFGIHMSLLYGEGEQAFRRLQEVILGRTEDYTIFAWRSPVSRALINCSLLATSPNDFHDRRSDEWRYSQLQPITNADEWWNVSTRADSNPIVDRRFPPLVTSRGIQLHLPLFSVSDKNVLALLVPVRGDSMRPDVWLCLPLLRTSTSDEVYSRHLSPPVVQSVVDMPTVAVCRFYGARMFSLTVVEPMTWLDKFFADTISDLLESAIISSMLSSDVVERLRSMAWCSGCNTYARKWPSLETGTTCCAKCSHAALSIQISTLESKKAGETITPIESTCLFISLHAKDKSDDTNKILDPRLRDLAAMIGNIYVISNPLTMYLMLCCIIISAKQCDDPKSVKLSQYRFLHQLCSTSTSINTVGGFAMHLVHQQLSEDPATMRTVMLTLLCCDAFANQDDWSRLAVSIAQSFFALHVQSRYLDRRSSHYHRFGHDYELVRILHLLRKPEEMVTGLRKVFSTQPAIDQVADFVSWLRNIYYRWTQHLTPQEAYYLFESLKSLLDEREPRFLDGKVTPMSIVLFLRYYCVSKAPAGSLAAKSQSQDEFARQFSTTPIVSMEAGCSSSSSGDAWHSLLRAIEEDAATLHRPHATNRPVSSPVRSSTPSSLYVGSESDDDATLVERGPTAMTPSSHDKSVVLVERPSGKTVQNIGLVAQGDQTGPRKQLVEPMEHSAIPDAVVAEFPTKAANAEDDLLIECFRRLNLGAEKTYPKLIEDVKAIPMNPVIHA